MGRHGVFLTVARSPEIDGLGDEEVARPNPQLGSNSIKMRRT